MPFSALRSQPTLSPASPGPDDNAAACFAAVACQDFPQRLSLQQQAAWLDDLTRQAPIYGGSLGVNFLALCSGYEDLQASTPVPRAPFPARRVSGLITGASWDAATPWVWSKAMARAFPSMRTLQVVGSEHGLYTNAHSSRVKPAQQQPFP